MIRSFIYNKLIFPLTKLCYAEVLIRLPENSHLLDVGIGTGKALCENKSIIRQKKLHITGIDINLAYLRTCSQLINKNNLQEFISLKELSFYDAANLAYDAVYFSSSFMLLPNQLQALMHAKKILAPQGKIYFTQTLHFKRNRIIEIVKPKLIYLTSINFGRITYEQDFLALLHSVNLNVIEYKLIKKWGKHCSEQLIVAQPIQNSL